MDDDFGRSRHLFLLASSTWRQKKISLNCHVEESRRGTCDVRTTCIDTGDGRLPTDSRRPTASYCIISCLN